MSALVVESKTPATSRWLGGSVADHGIATHRIPEPRRVSPSVPQAQGVLWRGVEPNAIEPNDEEPDDEEPDDDKLSTYEAVLGIPDIATYLNDESLDRMRKKVLKGRARKKKK